MNKQLCSFDYPETCPKCGSNDTDSDYYFHDADFRFRAQHAWNCWDCLYGEVDPCYDPFHRAEFDKKFGEYLVNLLMGVDKE